jgi:hypothetical protein
MHSAPTAANITESEEPSDNFGGDRDITTTEEHGLRAAWERAWLREFRCYTRYLALVAMEDDEKLAIQFAWLEWWDAASVCREAARRLECSEELQAESCPAGRTMSESCEPRT